MSIDDLHQIDRYAEKLRQAEKGEVSMAVITGSGYTLSGTARKGWQERDDIELLTWAEIHARAKSFYEHYRAVLEGDVEDSGFGRKASEIARTRNVLAAGAYRGPDVRNAGLGNQDRDYPVDGGDS